MSVETLIAALARRFDPSLPVPRVRRAESLVTIAAEQRCVPSLAGTVDARIDALVERYTAGAVFSNARLRRETESAIERLRSAGIPVLLLKGAARAVAEPELARQYPSFDIDLLVPRECEFAAIACFKEAGYRQTRDSERRAFYARHHHAAPLEREGFRPIEIHRSLADPRGYSTDTSWNGLRPGMRTIGDGVAVLDGPYGALHLAIHAATNFTMRDVALIAERLSTFTAEESARYAALLAAERIDGARLRGIAYLAARLAAVEYRPEPLARAYAAWTVRREDLPRALRTRVQFVEAGFALLGGSARGARRLASVDAGGVRAAAQVPVRCAAAAAGALLAMTPRIPA